VVVIGSKAYLFGGCGGEQVRTEPTTLRLSHCCSCCSRIISNTQLRLLCPISTKRGTSMRTFLRGNWFGMGNMCWFPGLVYCNEQHFDGKNTAPELHSTLPFVLRYVVRQSSSRTCCVADVGRIKTNRNFLPLPPYNSVGLSSQ